MLEGHRFVVFTDHEPLVGAFSRRWDLWAASQSCNLSFIAEFVPTIFHIAGHFTL
jgi:hypothetical protein